MDKQELERLLAECRERDKHYGPGQPHLQNLEQIESLKNRIKEIEEKEKNKK
jgi:hypothetical protein